MASWKKAFKYAFKISTITSFSNLLGTILIIVGITFLSKAIFLFIFSNYLFSILSTLGRATSLLGKNIPSQFFYSIQNFLFDLVIGAVLIFLGSLVKALISEASRIKYFAEYLAEELEK